MKTTDQILKENGLELNEEGFAAFEKSINEVISQRAGEPVAWLSNELYSGSPVVSAQFIKDKPEFKHHYDKPCFLAADPSVIEYVKSINELLEEQCGDRCHQEHNPCWARHLLNSAPDSIKHLL